MATCRICSNSDGNRQYTAREMLLGYREQFEYFECARCGCLQIRDIPDDIQKYYPAECFYYDRREQQLDENNSIPLIKRLKIGFIKRQISKFYTNGTGLLGSWLERKSSLAGEYPVWLKLNRLNLGLGMNSHILDVGCGSGGQLLGLQNIGFSNLTGIDPFIEKDITLGRGVRLLKRDLESLKEPFDFIMMHNVFEHVPEPLSTLKKLNDLLEPGSYALLRIPVVDSYGWKNYGVYWALLDAPRHFHLHTAKSMNLLAQQAGFEVASVVFDSDSFTFWGSEQYLRDIPLMDTRSYANGSADSIFTEEQIKSFEAQAIELNAKGEGDCASFYLRKN